MRLALPARVPEQGVPEYTGEFSTYVEWFVSLTFVIFCRNKFAFETDSDS